MAVKKTKPALIIPKKDKPPLPKAKKNTPALIIPREALAQVKERAKSKVVRRPEVGKPSLKRNLNATNKQVVLPTKKIKVVKVVSPTKKIKVVKSVTVAPKKSTPKKNGKKNTLLNRIKEDWSQPTGGYNKDTGRTFEPGYDKYPYGSLTGRKK